MQYCESYSAFGASMATTDDAQGGVVPGIELGSAACTLTPIVFLVPKRIFYLKIVL